MCLTDFCKLPKVHNLVWPEAQPQRKAPYIKTNGNKVRDGKLQMSLIIEPSYQFSTSEVRVLLLFSKYLVLCL